MQDLAERLRDLPADIDVHGPEPAFVATLSDAALVEAVASAIARPKEKGSSYTLHAPMELLARATLLPLVSPAARSAGRMRIAAIAALYARGAEIDPPRQRFASPDAAAAALLPALRARDADTADAALSALAPHLSGQDLCAALTDEIAPNLGAAAHAPILLSALPEAAARYGNLSMLLRTALRGLAASSTRLTWMDGPRNDADPPELWEALAAPPHLKAWSTSIAPTMLAVEADGLAAGLLWRATDIEPGRVGKMLLRLAALSMLQDDSAHAPYGWSHCLTLPQGLMALAPYSADAGRLARIAATFVLGFRSTLGKVRLERDWQAPAPTITVPALAAHALVHRDAHLAKYTAACLRAAADDPPARDLFLAAAAFLGAWWDARPDYKGF